MIRCKSILIADDNDDIRDSVEDALRGEGYKVAIAKNGKEALQKLKQLEAPTLVLLDLMMPVMSGWEFLDAQKENAVFAANPVVVMSAVAPTQSLEDSTPLDTAGKLSKPLSLGKLLDLVSTYCEPTESADADLDEEIDSIRAL